MSKGFNSLHSHSGLERELKFKKYLVLVDEEYKHVDGYGILGQTITQKERTEREHHQESRQRHLPDK